MYISNWLIIVFGRLRKIRIVPVLRIPVENSPRAAAAATRRGHQSDAADRSERRELRETPELSTRRRCRP